MTDKQFEEITKDLNFYSEGGADNLCTMTETSLRALLDKASKTIVAEHFEAYGQCRDSRRIAELEKKNAELREKLYGGLLYAINDKLNADLFLLEKLNKEQKEQLTKAKEVITALLNVFVYDMADDEMDAGHTDTKIKAEKFLKETSHD